jgi:hypothetical protein
MRSSSRAGRCWRPPVSAASHFHSGFQTWLTAYSTRSRPCRSLTSRSASGKRSRRRASAQRASTKCGKVHGSSTAPRISMWASGWGSWQAAAARPRAGRCCGARQRHGRPADDQPVVVGDLAGKHRGKQPIEFLDRLPAGLNPRTRDTGRWSQTEPSAIGSASTTTWLAPTPRSHASRSSSGGIVGDHRRSSRSESSSASRRRPSRSRPARWRARRGSRRQARGHEPDAWWSRRLQALERSQGRWCGGAPCQSGDDLLTARGQEHPVGDHGHGAYFPCCPGGPQSGSSSARYQLWERSQTLTELVPLLGVPPLNRG